MAKITTTTDFGEAENSAADYLVFYSSVDPNLQKMWCPDCRRVEDTVNEAFAKEGAPSALIVFVGQRAEWKKGINPQNVFRGEPFNIESIPTIIRRQDYKEVSRLVDQEITAAALKDFIEASSHEAPN